MVCTEGKSSQILTWMLDMGPEGNSNFMSAAALFDFINGTSAYRDMVVEGLNTVVRLNVTTALQP